MAIPAPPWETEEQSKNEKPVLEVKNYQLQQLTVHPYEWQIIDGQSSEEKTELRAWCLDRESNPYLLRIMDYPVFVHLELPKIVGGVGVNWNDFKIRAVYNYLRRKLGRDKPNGYKLIKANKLYYYQDPRNPTFFLRLFFNNLKSMRACKTHLNYPRRIPGIGNNVKLSLHETQITPIRKMLTEKECGYSQWFNSEGRAVTEREKVSTLSREFIINWKSIQPLDVDWVTDPGILAVDAEVYSKNRNAFPDAWNPADDAYMLSCVYQRSGRPETLRKILIIYGVSSPPSKGDEYIFVNSEEEMCYKFAEIVNKLDPEIVTGYNIFGFDYPYLNKRLVRKGLKWPAMGRIRGKETILTGNNWSSSGYGHNSIKYLDMDGRINVDMMHIIKREHKLPTYTLESVGQHFLGVGKDNVPPQMMFDVVTLMKMLQDVLETFREPSEKGGGEKIPDILFALKTSDSIIEYIHQKQAEKQMFSKKEYNQIIKLVEYVLDEMNKIAKYCIKDSVLVLNLFSKLNVWIYLIQLSNVAGVTPLQLFTRGQQIRGLSLIYDLAARSGFVIDSRNYSDMSWSGGFVWEPIPGLWHWVICLDFKSLYPNIIRAYNICWTTLVPSWSAIKDECCNIIEWDEPIDKEDYIKDGDDPDEDGTEKGKTSPGMGKIIIKMEEGEEVRYIHYKFRFLKKKYREGLLPQQAGMLIDERNKIRKAMRSESDPTKKMIMNQRQLGMKVTANSLFGLLGAGERGKLPLLEGAMSITAKGRELIKFSNDYLAKKYNASIIYNDTDSTMVQIPGVTNGPDCLIWGKKLELELSALFPDPLYLEFEKAGRQLTIKKKMYLFWILDKFGNLPRNEDGTPKYMAKGLPLARRDKSQWQLKIVRAALDMIIQEQPNREFLDMVIKYVITTLRGEHNWKSFSIIKSLGSGYIKQTYFMKVFADQLRLIGKPAKPGDRLTFVIVEPRDHPNNCLLGYKMRLLDTYLERLDSDRPEQINYFYYINNLLMDCIDNYWRVGYKPIIDKIEAQNLLDDKWKILNELIDIGLGGWVTEALKNNDQNPGRAVEALKLTQIKNKVIMARRKHISGRKVFDSRINGKPIKTILKGHLKDRLEEAVKSLASPKLYSELYPKIKVLGLNGVTIQLSIS